MGKGDVQKREEFPQAQPLPEPIFGGNPGLLVELLGRQPSP